MGRLVYMPHKEYSCYQKLPPIYKPLNTEHTIIINSINDIYEHVAELFRIILIYIWLPFTSILPVHIQV